MPPLDMVLGQVSITTSSCLVSPWPTHPVQSHLSLPHWVTLPSMDHPVSPWLQSGLWHPGLVLHSLFSSNLAAPCPAVFCCWFSSCLHLEQHMATHPWASWGGSEWHKPSCDLLVNVAASRARALSGPGCGCCVTGGQQPVGGVQHQSWLLVACPGSALCAQCCCQHPPWAAGSPQHPQLLAGDGVCQTRCPGWPAPAEPMNKIKP